MHTVTNSFGFLLTDVTINALAFAQRAHFHQTDAIGAPYILHLINVAQHVPQNETCVAAALLHDTLEDTFVTKEELEYKFGETIADAVQTLTRSPHETYSQYIDRCTKDAITHAVKFSDILDHLAEYRAAGLTDSLRNRYETALCTLIKTQPR